MEPEAERPPNRVWRDWPLAAVVGAATVLEVVLRDDLLWPPVALTIGLVLALMMLRRRTHPLSSAALAFGTLIVLDVTSAVITGQPFSLYAGGSVMVLVYALFRWGSTEAAAIGLLLVLMEVAVIAVTDFTGLDDLAGGLLVLLFPAALGASIRYRHLAQAQRFEQVRAHEREILARESHDTVAHHVSAIAIQAQAGRFHAGSGNVEGAADALEVIEREASNTLTEMRSVVESLRRENRPSFGVSGRGVRDIKALGTADGAHGIRVDVEHRGDLSDLPMPVQSALYRVAQESVTNARRHARNATRVRVSMFADDQVVELTISDDGERTSVVPGAVGYGLVGMAERLTLLGGTVQAGPAPERGWLVSATIAKRGGSR